MAGMAGAAIAPTLTRATPSNPDVVVIGAGAAGLAAARRLLEAGRSVVVLEAADRIGGRAWTISEPFGSPWDVGCAWLQGPSDLPHLEVARAEGFGLVDYSNSEEAVFAEGRRATNKERNAYWRSWAAVERAFERAEGQDVSMASLLPRGTWRASVEAWTGPMDHGADLRDVSVADWHGYADYDVDLLVREGLGTLVAAVGRTVPVRLNTPATHIDWSGQGVRVETPDGTIEASACVVTVSVGVLAAGAIRFTPELPAAKRDAFEGVPMGLLERIGLQFDGDRFGLPETGLLTNLYEGPSPRPACHFLTFAHGSDVVTGFVGGSFGWELSAEGEAAAVDFALGEFVRAVGSDARKRFVRGAFSGWAGNPLTRGAYAYARPGRFADRAALGEDLGERVFFAGEATSPDLYALMSGAHLSGEAAAHDVIATLARAEGCSSCDARRTNMRKLPVEAAE